MINFITRNRASLALICAITAVLVITGEVHLEERFNTPTQTYTAGAFIIVFIVLSFAREAKQPIHGKSEALVKSGSPTPPEEHHQLEFLKTLIGHSFWIVNDDRLLIFYNNGDLQGTPNLEISIAANSFEFVRGINHRQFIDEIGFLSDSAFGYLTSPIRSASRNYSSVLAVCNTGQVTVLTELFEQMQNKPSAGDADEEEVKPYIPVQQTETIEVTFYPTETMSKKQKLNNEEDHVIDPTYDHSLTVHSTDAHSHSHAEYGDADFGPAHTVATPNEVHRHDKRLYADIHSFAQVPKSVQDLEQKLMAWGRDFKTHTNGHRVYFDVASYNQPARVRVPLTGGFEIA